MISKGKEKEVLDKRIMAARQAAGFSITEAAQKLGFKNYQTLSAIEKGARNINARNIFWIFRKFL